ncbi:MAG: alpha/beta hydrolase [Polyangiaceae bacterium]|nr:alpha/beta hydrolase [Polyangiaceae bacterium]
MTHDTNTSLDQNLNRVRLSDGELEYLDEGSGPAVVLVHPFLTDTRHYRKLVPLLSQNHRVIVPLLQLGAHRVPLPESSSNTPLDLARRVAELIRELRLGPVTLLGNDSGGAISQMVAAHHRDVVARLVLANCDAYEVFPPKEFAYLGVVGRSQALLRLTSWLLQRSKALRHGPLTFGRLSQDRIPDALVKSYCEPLSDPKIARDTAKLCGAFSPRQTLEAARILAAKPLPLRLVWGTADPFFSVQLAERLQRDVQGAVLVRLPQAMAFVPEDDPQALADAVRAIEATDAAQAACTTN